MKTSATAQDSWATYGSNNASSGLPRAFFWDWYQRAELGPELLGDVRGRTVVELGAGTGKQAALIASTMNPAKITAIDSSPPQHARALELHAHSPRLELVHANAVDYLQHQAPAVDVCYSVFGAVDFTEPRTLLPAVLGALAPGGLFVFSTLGHFHNGQPAETQVRPAQIPVRHADGTHASLNRWVLAPELWAELLEEAGFSHTELLTFPDPGLEGRPPVVTNTFRAHRTT